MNTLDFVKNNKVMLAIISKAEQEDLCVLEADSGKVIVKAMCLPVEITWEMCDCHGGRMWFSQTNTNIHIELSSDEYDEENGIVDPQTELAYYIDNKMIDIVRSFEKYVYVVEVIGEYKEGEKKVHYFNSIDNASRFVFDEGGHDINSEYGVVVHQYPNPNIQKRVTYIGEEKGVLKFKGERIDKDIPHKSYDINFRVYRKKH